MLGKFSQMQIVTPAMSGGTMMIRAALIAALLCAAPAQAQEISLRFHQFVSPLANIPAHLLKPWGARLEAASGGRLKIEFYDSMVLGGKPADLYDQAKDGIVDIVMTLPGYTPGRFPRSEVFELPFFVRDNIAASKALMTMIDEDLSKSEFSDVHILAAWLHGPGVLHTNQPIRSLDDLRGLQIRAPGRLAGQLLSALGAVPVGMALTAVPENLTNGVINGALIPWDIAPSIRLAELIGHHTEFGGDTAIYTAELVIVMNKASYDALPDDLRAILDAESGVVLSELAATIQVGGDAPVRAAALERGNDVTVLDAAETERWKAAAQPVREAWLAEMQAQGIDGAALIARAEALMAQFGG